MSCGLLAVKPFHWKQWACPTCSTGLATSGNVTMLGRMLQQYHAIGSCYPGLVHFKGVQFPPDAKKLAKVLVPPKAVMIKSGNRWMPYSPALLVPDLEPKAFRMALVGLAIDGAIPAVLANTRYNCLKVLVGRVFRVPKNRPSERAFQLARSCISVLMCGFTDPLEPMSVEDWIESMPSRRRAALRLAHALYLRDGLQKKYLRFSAFAKTEKLPSFAKSGDGFVSCETAGCIERLIQGPHDVTHIVMGPKLKPLISRLKTIWHEAAPIFYGSRSRSDIDAWLERNHEFVSSGVCVACDYSMYDNCHSDLSWDLLEEIYQACGFVDSDARKVLLAWRKPQGKMSGNGWTIKYQAATMNASGRDDTALANGVLNGIAMFISITAVIVNKRVSDVDAGDVCRCINLIRISVTGDDSFGFVLQAPVARLIADTPRNIAEFGFEAKLCCPETIFEQIYLGMRRYPTNGRWYLGRTIGRALYKVGFKSAPFGKSLGAWMAGECQAICLTEAHVPILSDFAAAYLRWWGSRPVTPFVPDPNRPWTTGERRPAYDQSTLEYVAQGYGVTVGLVEACIAEIRAIEQFPCVLSSPLLGRMVTVDEL